MQEMFEDWGIDLGEEAFARAVAGRMAEFGCVQWRGEDSRWRPLLEGSGTTRPGRKGAPGDWGTIRRRWKTAPAKAAEMAEGWLGFAKYEGDLRAVVPDVEKAGGDDAAFAFEVMGLLGSVEPPFASIIADTAPRRVRVREWAWPLRVGIAPGFDGAEIAQQTVHWEFFEMEEASTRHKPWDIFIIPGTLGEALAAFAAQKGRVRARCVIITGREDDIPRAALSSTMASVRALADAHAILIARVSSLSGTGTKRETEILRTANLLTRTAAELAHDKSLDEALFYGARFLDARATPLISGDLPFFDSTPPSRRLSRIAHKLVVTHFAFKGGLPLLREFPGMERLGEKERPASGFGVRPENGFDFRGGPDPFAELPAMQKLEEKERPETRQGGSMGRTLIKHAAMVDWHMETLAATGTARLAKAMKPTLEEAGEQSEARYLTSGVKRVQSEGKTGGWVKHLEVANTYALYVWIGPFDPAALPLSVPFPKPSEEDEPQELDVVLNEPFLLRKPVVGKLLLPPVGKSTSCLFFIHCHPGVERIEARIVVLHRGRILQTGVLRGAIVARGGATTKDGELHFDLDAAPRKRLAALSGRSLFGAAIVANHSENGDPQQLGIVGGRVARIKLGDATLQALTDRFNAAISDIAAAPDDYARLRSPGTISLLRDLAQHGAALHRAIYKHNKVGPTLAQEPRLQIVTTREGGFLPLELAYRFEAPDDDATLCEGAEDALAAALNTEAPGGDGAVNLDACAAKCGPQPGGTAKRICPMGFWCLWKTIERFEHRAEAIEETADYALFAEAIGSRPTLPRPSFGLVAASKKAEEYDTQAVSRVLAVVKGAFTDGAKVDDWEAWATGITSSHPGLLVLLPHHLREAGNSLLQIGAASNLKSTLVKARHVVGDPAPDLSPKPIVLLLGCETQDSPIAIEGFPGAFLDCGASIVVATIATVLGRDAAPAAEDILALLAESGIKERSFGDLLVMARRRLLLKGKAMALALAGFGDADWRLS